jgi:hypothetical protein
MLVTQPVAPETEPTGVSLTQTNGEFEERRSDPPASPGEPSGAWVAWIAGAFVVLLVVLIAIGPDAEVTDSAASSYQEVGNRRSADSIAVLALAADTSMPAEQLLTLEAIMHLRAFPIPHEAAHRRSNRLLLDSAETLVGKGLTTQARTVLTIVGAPDTRADSARASRLNERIVRVEEEQARESARLQRLAQEQAAEARIERMRGLRQDSCTPPARAVRNRVRKNPEWSDEMIATTACNRVHIGMTREQAIAGWGRPRDINRTSGSYGVHEQWVYGEYGSGYLYFEDGVLTTIQN